MTFTAQTMHNTAMHGDVVTRIYSREAFREILSRQPEWKVRAALEEGNIPSPHEQEAREWLEEKAAEYRACQYSSQH
jgi:hypothetical protein